jgi:hypothetical protein
MVAMYIHLNIPFTLLYAAHVPLNLTYLVDILLWFVCNQSCGLADLVHIQGGGII